MGISKARRDVHIAFLAGAFIGVASASLLFQAWVVAGVLLVCGGVAYWLVIRGIDKNGK